jgi:hypothetical protein
MVSPGAAARRRLRMLAPQETDTSLDTVGDVLEEVHAQFYLQHEVSTVVSC